MHKFVLYLLFTCVGIITRPVLDQKVGGFVLKLNFYQTGRNEVDSVTRDEINTGTGSLE